MTSGRHTLSVQVEVRGVDSQDESFLTAISDFGLHDWVWSTVSGVTSVTAIIELAEDLLPRNLYYIRQCTTWFVIKRVLQAFPHAQCTPVRES